MRSFYCSYSLFNKPANKLFLIPPHKRCCFQVNSEKNGQQKENRLIYLKEEQVDESPWQLGFQLNERYVAWNEKKEHQLITLVTAKKLGKEVEYVQQKVKEICTLLPDVAARINVLKPDLLVALIQNIEVVPQKCIRLKELMPSIDISKMIAQNISLFIECPIEKIEQNIYQWQKELNVSMHVVESIIIQEPFLLQINAKEVIKEIKRLLPKDDPVKVILRDPGSVLSMTQAGQMSSVERIQ